MKRLIITLISLMMLLSLASCNSAEPTSDLLSNKTTLEATQGKTAVESTTMQPTMSESTSNTTIKEETQPMKIRLTANEKTAIVELLDNDATADFVSMLPLTLTFEDYNNTEKIATLPRELNIGSAPTNCNPDVGTFAYYAPWGNLSVFYNDFRESDSLIPLGNFVSGIDIFAETNGDFTVTIELEDN